MCYLLTKLKCFRLGVNVNNLATAAVSRLQGELAKEGREPASTAFKRSRDNIFPEKVAHAKSPERKTGQDQYYLLFHHGDAPYIF